MSIIGVYTDNRKSCGGKTFFWQFRYGNWFLIYCPQIDKPLDIPEILQCTDVFILPSLFEGFGIVLVESQAAGVMSFTSETVVPKDVQITELLHYLPLEESPYFWAKQILNKSKYIKKDRSEELNHAGITVESMMENIQRLLLS